MVKNAIIVIDATPFRQWYESHYALPLGRKKGAKLVSCFRPLYFSFSIVMISTQVGWILSCDTVLVLYIPTHDFCHSYSETNYMSTRLFKSLQSLTFFFFMQTEAEEAVLNKKNNSQKVVKKYKLRQRQAKLETALDEQFLTGRLLAAISSRPGQCGRADGYILEGRELEFYLKKMKTKKGK